MGPIHRTLIGTTFAGQGEGGSNGLVLFVGFYGISTFVGYLTPNPFLCK